MKVFRIDISSWTASFRYPNLISGFQPTLEVPPLSTILGLLNAAAGKYLVHQNLQLGYFFQYGAKSIDLETIYQIMSDNKGRPSNSAKSNVVKREFLFETNLSIYLKDEYLKDCLNKPFYDIVIGRSNDLATIERISTIELNEVHNASKIKGQIVPMKNHRLPGKIQALPQYFSNTIPRQNLGTEPYSVIDFHAKDLDTQITAFRDMEQLNDGVDIFFHTVSNEAYD